jgi:hypothetical protein
MISHNELMKELLKVIHELPNQIVSLFQLNDSVKDMTMKLSYLNI